MRLPQGPEDADPRRARARRRLREARDEERRLADLHDAAERPVDEEATEKDLNAGRKRVASREVWLAWLERGR